MLSYSKARAVIEDEGLSRQSRLRCEIVPLLDCVGRYAAQDFDALDSNPRFDNSAMDGYAVLSAETSRASKSTPVSLRVVGCIAAGEPTPNIEQAALSCSEIMTGARIPEGYCDAVIRVEDVQEQRDESGQVKAVFVSAPVNLGENIRKRGEDFSLGQRLITKGTRMGPQHLLALSMAGVASIEVYARPRVVIISTGNELVSFDSSEPLEYQIRNSTAPLLVAALKACGVSIEFQGIVADDAEQLERALLTAIEQRPDIIITTGGVSVGKFDLVESAFSKLGGKVHFHKAAVRPGKPILFGEFAGYEFTGKGPTFFGLAGNPLAVAAAIRFFVKPYLCALFGEGPEKPQRLPLTEDVQKPAGLSFFQGGVRDGQGVKALSGQASFMAASFLKAEGWIVGQPELARINAGDLVEWYPLW